MTPSAPSPGAVQAAANSLNVASPIAGKVATAREVRHDDAPEATKSCQVSGTTPVLPSLSVLRPGSKLSVVKTPPQTMGNCRLAPEFAAVDFAEFWYAE
ncbi:hypothetical protein [Streptomyces beijiangensis]|uniref:Uncharacterized protein n=1 Tax=Streptomyces beijiangensis TaxID=163361 RepID=A0A939FHW9_9ACTN|nr:hypothetical protein [Streptomyces beijiangensis]MBO0517707.1 hypothetical protein [Streptomyces beijiangensis]